MPSRMMQFLPRDVTSLSSGSAGQAEVIVKLVEDEFQERMSRAVFSEKEKARLSAVPSRVVQCAKPKAFASRQEI